MKNEECRLSSKDLERNGIQPQIRKRQCYKMQQHEHKARVVVMHSKGYRSYGSYTSWEVAIVHLQSLQEKVSMHHFELIAETERCKPYFDFDYVYTNVFVPSCRSKKWVID